MLVARVVPAGWRCKGRLCGYPELLHRVSGAECWSGAGAHKRDGWMDGWMDRERTGAGVLEGKSEGAMMRLPQLAQRGLTHLCQVYPCTTTFKNPFSFMAKPWMT